MDFDDTPAEAAFRAEARGWLEANAPAKGGADDFSDGYLSGRVDEATHAANCKRWQRALFDGGWAGLAWPKAFGGQGRTPADQSIFNQEVTRFGVSVGVFAVAHGMVGPTLMRHGTPEQQRRFLPAMLRGEELWCQLFSEPGAGSDLAAITTRAVRDGDEFVVTGQKVWTSSAAESDWGILLARTNWDVPKHRGITYLLVDMRSAGIDVRPLTQLNRMSHFNEVFLDEVRVPVANVVGEVDGGWRVAVTTLSNERVAIGGSTKGDEFMALVALARSLGRTDEPVVRQRLAASYTRHNLLRFLRYRMQTAISRGRSPGPEASIMKLVYADHVKGMAELAVDLQGPAGSLWRDPGFDSFWQGRFLMSPSLSIGGGTNEVQLNVVAERSLGLPPEPRTDREVPFRELQRG
ncbi:MAG: acyl-CoA dehydrogenase family protein [Acidimicrobiales bacterium]